MTTTLPTVDRAQLQKKTLTTLFASTVAARASMSLAFTVAGLAIKEMLDSDRLAGLSTVAITVGTAAGAAFLSSMMAQRGRNPGLRSGYAVAAVGSLVAAIGVQTSSLALFLAGLAAFGVGQGATNLARYAAADLAEPDKRATSISLIVFASTIGAVGGPNLAGPFGSLAERAGWNELMGPFVGAAASFLIAGVLILVFLRPDPLVVSGGTSASTAAGPSKSSSHRLGFTQAMALAWSQPLARLAVLALVISQAVMVTVMTMTPLHMDAHGHSTTGIGAVISAHTAGMFLFAPLAGALSDRIGRIPTIAIGAIILALSTVITALAGEAPNLLMFPGLYLLGLGWSLAMVAGSALLTESIEADDRVSVQGSVDVATSVASGAGALASGFVFDMAGFHVLSMIGTLASGLLFIASFVRHRITPALS